MNDEAHGVAGAVKTDALLRWGAVTLLVLPTLLAITVAITKSTALRHPTDDPALLQIYLHEAAFGHFVLGAYSRFGLHHPGPLYWYLLSPAYRLGACAVASVYVGVGLVSLGCLGAAVVSWRRVATDAQTRVLVALLALLMAFGFPPAATTEIWNPVAGLLPFSTLLVVGPAVSAGAVSLLPLACFLHAVASQAHIQFALPATVALALPLVQFLRQREGRGRWIVPTTLLVVSACWAPVAWDAVRNHGGNVRRLALFFLGVSAPPPRDPNRWGPALLEFGGDRALALFGVGDRWHLPVCALVSIASVGALLFVHERSRTRLRSDALARAAVFGAEAQLVAAAFAVFTLPGPPRWYLLLFLQPVMFACWLGSLSAVSDPVLRFGRAISTPRAAAAVLLLVAAVDIFTLQRTLPVGKRQRTMTTGAQRGLLGCLSRVTGVGRPVLEFTDRDAWRIGAGIALEGLETGVIPRLAAEERYRFGDAFEYLHGSRHRNLPTVYISFPSFLQGGRDQVGTVTPDFERPGSLTLSGLPMRLCAGLFPTLSYRLEFAVASPSDARLDVVRNGRSIASAPLNGPGIESVILPPAAPSNDGCVELSATVTRDGSATPAEVVLSQVKLRAEVPAECRVMP